MKKIYDLPKDGLNAEYRVKTYELTDEENLKLNEKYGDGETKYRIILTFENDKVMKDKVQILNVTEVAAYTKPYEEIAALIDLNQIS